MVVCSQWLKETWFFTVESLAKRWHNQISCSSKSLLLLKIFLLSRNSVISMFRWMQASSIPISRAVAASALWRVMFHEDST